MQEASLTLRYVWEGACGCNGLFGLLHCVAVSCGEIVSEVYIQGVPRFGMGDPPRIGVGRGQFEVVSRGEGDGDGLGVTRSGDVMGANGCGGVGQGLWLVTICMSRKHVHKSGVPVRGGCGVGVWQACMHGPPRQVSTGGCGADQHRPQMHVLVQLCIGPQLSKQLVWLQGPSGLSLPVFVE